MALEAVQRGEVELPIGCEVTYELEAINILRSLIRSPKPDEALRVWYDEFTASHGERPTAVEAFHEGYSPRSARKSYGSWLRFVDAMGGLPDIARRVLDHLQAGELLDILEITPMTKSLKMVVLMTMLNADQLPGRIEIDSLTEGFAQLVRRSAKLKADVEVDLENSRALRKYLEQNPINAWVGGKGTRKKPFFSYRNGIFQTTFSLEEDLRSIFQDLVHEVADWRLAEYLQRPALQNADARDIVCKVSHAGGRPILFLPNRKLQPNIPRGWTDILVEGEPHEANFVKVAVNVMRRKGQSKNVLAEILRGWFGADAGLPGTNQRVIFRNIDENLILESVEHEPI